MSADIGVGPTPFIGVCVPELRSDHIVLRLKRGGGGLAKVMPKSTWLEDEEERLRAITSEKDRSRENVTSAAASS
jgi:hypothetical protein